MDRTALRRFGVLLVTLASVTAACGGGSASLERYDIPGTEFSIQHPQGWQTVTEAGATLLAETEDAFRGAFEQDPPPLSDLTIVFDHREIAFMEAIGLTGDATLLDLFLFNVENFGWQALGGTWSTEVLGEEALSARVKTSIGVSEVIQGYLPGGEEIFLLQVSGPDEAALDDFDPTWDVIVVGLRIG